MSTMAAIRQSNITVNCKVYECLRVYVLIRTPKCPPTLSNVILISPLSLNVDGSWIFGTLLLGLFGPSTSSSVTDSISIFDGDTGSLLGLQDLELLVDQRDVSGDLDRLALNSATSCSCTLSLRSVSLFRTQYLSVTSSTCLQRRFIFFMSASKISNSLSIEP